MVLDIVFEVPEKHLSESITSCLVQARSLAAIFLSPSIQPLSHPLHFTFLFSLVDIQYVCVLVNGHTQQCIFIIMLGSLTECLHKAVYIVGKGY